MTHIHISSENLIMVLLCWTCTWSKGVVLSLIILCIENTDVVFQVSIGTRVSNRGRVKGSIWCLAQSIYFFKACSLICKVQGFDSRAASCLEHSWRKFRCWTVAGILNSLVPVLKCYQPPSGVFSAGNLQQYHTVPVWWWGTAACGCKGMVRNYNANKKKQAVYKCM